MATLNLFTTYLGDLVRDVRFAMRAYQRSPGFTALAVLPLGLGIAASTAIFSLVYTVLVKPLPFSEPSRLVMLWQRDSRGSGGNDLVRGANFADWRAENDCFTAMVAFNENDKIKFPSPDGYQVARAATATPQLFSLLGVKPLIGRDFTPEEETRKDSGAAIISYSLWEKRYRRDPSAIGSSLLVDLFGERVHTIVGVMPPDVSFPRDIDIWLPSAYFFQRIPPPGSAERGGSGVLEVIARLKPGVTLEVARARMRTIAQRIAVRFPGQFSPADIAVVPLREQWVGNYRGLMLLLAAAVACLLLIVSVNVAGLLFARSIARKGEIVVRASLGATRGRIIRQLLVESVVLASLGAFFGIALASAGIPALAYIFSRSIPLAATAKLDNTVLGFALLLTCIVAILSGLAPAASSSDDGINCGIRQSSQGSGAPGWARRLRGVLVVIEYAATLALMTVAGLLVRSFDRLQHVDPGFRPDHLILRTIDLNIAPISRQEQKQAFVKDLVRRMEALPNVTSAAIVGNAPLTGDTYGDEHISLEGVPESPGGSFTIVNENGVTPRYFETMGIPVMSGRPFTEADDANHAWVTVVSQTAVKRYWGGESPVGRRIFYGPQHMPILVVGVVGDVLTLGLEKPARPDVYFSYRQFVVLNSTLLVRFRGPTAEMNTAIHSALWSLNGLVPVTRELTGQELVADSIQQPRFRAFLLSVLSAIALILAAIGIYGVMSYSVAQRTREIGVRMALGASGNQILMSVLRNGLWLSAAGFGLGFPLAVVSSRAVAGLLYGVPPLDVANLGGVAAILAGVTLLAAYFPARRAAATQPIEAMRYE